MRSVYNNITADTRDAANTREHHNYFVSSSTQGFHEPLQQISTSDSARQTFRPSATSTPSSPPNINRDHHPDLTHSAKRNANIDTSTVNEDAATNMQRRVSRFQYTKRRCQTQGRRQSRQWLQILKRNPPALHTTSIHVYIPYHTSSAHFYAHTAIRYNMPRFPNLQETSLAAALRRAHAVC